MFKKITYAILLILSLASITANAAQYFPDNNGRYSVSFDGESYGNYVITAVKGLYEEEQSALEALYAAQDNDITYYELTKADIDGKVLFDKIIPFTYTDASIFISGTGLEKPILLGELLADGNSDIAKAVFVGIENSYTVKGKGASAINEKVSAYTVDSFGFPTLSNPMLSLSLENGDEYVSLSEEGLLTISPMSQNKDYTIKASLENGFSDIYTFSVVREEPRPYEISVFRHDFHDRPMTSASLVGVDGKFPALEVYALSRDQFGNDITDTYTFFASETEYPDGFRPSEVGEYTVYVASKANPDVRTAITVTVTNRPDYTGNAALLYEAVSTALAEIDIIDYKVFVSAENGRDIYPEKLWTTDNALTALKSAVDNANTYLSEYQSGTYTDEDYLTAYNTLIAAIEAYRNTLKNGIRVDASDIHVDFTLSTDAVIPVTNGVINLQQGNTRKNYVDLTAILDPTENTDIVTWSASEEGIVTIQNTGAQSVRITGAKTGRVTVTASTRTGLSYDCEFNIYVPYKEILMSQREGMLLGGESLTLSCTVSPENKGDVLTWTSSDESVATVDETGAVTAHSTGVVTITATSILGRTGSTIVTVGLPADSISLGVDDTVNMQTYGSLSIGAYASRIDGLEPLSKEVTYKITDSVPQSSLTSKREVITLTPDGFIRAQNGGTAIVRIEAVSALSRIYKDITINVFSPAQSLTLSSLRKNMIVGSTLSLYADLLPDDTTDNITWYSTKENVATVDQNGFVTALSQGTARIYSESDSGITKYCTVNVGFGPDKIKISSKAYSLEEGDIAFLRAKAVRRDGTKIIDQNVNYSIISGKNSVRINSYGTVTALSQGTATIRISSVVDSSVYTDVTITVCEKITELSFIQDKVTMYTGQTFDFAPLVNALPETHTDIIAFESSAQSHLTVDENGTATALKKGTVRLYALGGNLSAFITVEIKTAAHKVEIFAPQTDVLTFGESFVLGAKATDSAGKILSTGVTWESSDPEIITVSPDGTLKVGTKAGVATITASVNAGEKHDSITFTVIPALYEVRLSDSTASIKIGQSIDVMDILSFYDADGNAVDSELCTVALRSRNETVASTDGSIITAASDGSTSVRIIVYCGNVSRNVNLSVKVTAPEPQQNAELSNEQISVTEENTEIPEETIHEDFSKTEELSEKEATSEEDTNYNAPADDTSVEESIPDTETDIPVEQPEASSVLEEAENTKAQE